MQRYTDEAEKLKLAGDTNFCVPLAVSLVSGKCIKEIDADMRETPSQSRPGKTMRVKGAGVYARDWKWYIKERLGLKLFEVETTAATIRTLERVLDPSRRYIIQMKGHVGAFVDGSYQDWAQGRKHRIERVYEVLSAGQKVGVSNINPHSDDVYYLILRDIAIKSGYELTRSGRWYSLKVPGRRSIPAVKVTIGKSDQRITLSLNKRDGRGYSAAVDHGYTIRERKADLIVEGVSIDHVADFIYQL